MLVYTDGSCLKNKNGGWAFCIVGEEEDVIVSCGEKETTNNRMELTAVIEALNYIKVNYKITSCKIKTDSKLTMNCGKKLWKRNKNIDLWKIFDNLYKDIKINWEWVKAHNGDYYNEIVDNAAREAAKNIE